MSIHIAARDVRTRMRQGAVGKPAVVEYGSKSLVNSNPQAAQVDTITVTGATALKTYTETIDGVAVSYVADATATIAEITDGLAAAINAEPSVRGKCSASSDGASIITVTGTIPGLAYTITDADAQLTTASVTTAASADAVPFGTLLVNPTGYVTDEAEEYGVRANSGLFTAQVVTLVPTYVATAATTIRIRDMHSGRIIADTTQTHDTDLADLIAELVADLNTQLPAASVIAANVGPGTSMTLTAEVAGLEFDVEVGLAEAGAATTPTCAKTYTTGPSRATSLLRAIEGVSLYASDEEATAAGTATSSATASYPANAGVRAMTHGQIWVTSAQTIANGEDVYVELSAASAARGQFYNTDSATRLLLPRDKFTWERDAESNSGDIAVLNVNLAAR